MKYFFICIIVLIISVSGYSQEINQIDSLGKKQGLWIERYYGITAKGRYVDTKKQGSWVTSAKESLLPQTIIEYKDDMMHGVFASFDYENNLRQLTYYEYGKKHGKSYYYLPNGSIEKIEEYKNDTANGRFVEYYENGNILKEVFYLSGKKDSIASLYNSDGILLAKMTYKNDLYNGAYLNYYTNGQVKVEKLFVENKLHGKFVEYYENGVIKTEGQYENGEKNGKWFYYDENGKKINKEKY